MKTLNIMDAKYKGFTVHQQTTLNMNIEQLLAKQFFNKFTGTHILHSQM